MRALGFPRTSDMREFGMFFTLRLASRMLLRKKGILTPGGFMYDTSINGIPLYQK